MGKAHPTNFDFVMELVGLPDLNRVGLLQIKSAVEFMRDILLLQSRV